MKSIELGWIILVIVLMTLLLLYLERAKVVIQPFKNRTSELFDIVDHVYYINLDHRKDRKSEIEKLFKTYSFDTDKITRISAVYNKQNGALGCTKSHIKVLNDFLKSPYKKCLVLEDDFTFKYSPSIVDDFFTQLKDSDVDYDIIQLSTHDFSKSHNVIDTEYSFLSKVLNGQSSASYIITKEFAPTLLDNLKYGLRKKQPLDIFWKSLQPSSKWYLSNPVLGKQTESYSDIVKQVVRNH